MTTLMELYGATSHTELVQWVVREYGIGAPSGADVNRPDMANPHRLRRAEIATRVRLYKDDAREDFVAAITVVFKKQRVRDQRIDLIDFCKEQNVTRKIIDEVANLYDKPCLRTLKARNEEFHAEEKRLHLHEIMQQASRLLYLCNEVIVWQYKSTDDKTRLKVVTPDAFDALPDPRDPLVMAGLLLDAAPLSIMPNRAQLPHYELWDDTYRYLLSAAGRLVDARGNEIAAPEAHGLNRIPGVLLHKAEPSDRILDSRPGRDITSAHLGIGLLNVMTMRLSKSQGERQPTLSGPTARVAMDQQADGESPLLLPPEVTASILDTVTDPKHYLDVKRDKLTAVGQTYGLSYETLAFQETSDSSSGKTYKARREKLLELRGEQVLRAPTNENAIVALMGFDPTGMKLDHQEQALPQDPLEEMALLDSKMRKGLDSPVAYLKRQDPELDDDAALELMKKNLTFWAVLLTMVRTLNVPLDDSGGGADYKKPGITQLGAEEANGGAGSTPAQNGAKNTGANDGSGTPQLGSAHAAA